MRGETKHIAVHPSSHDPNPARHLGEAQVLELAQRPEYLETAILLDERAARDVALEINLNVSGFAGVLVFAVSERLITPEQVRMRLEQCRRAGTHYGAALIERAYQLAVAASE